jgi:hypothetical protein
MYIIVIIIQNHQNLHIIIYSFFIYILLIISFSLIHLKITISNSLLIFISISLKSLYKYLTLSKELNLLLYDLTLDFLHFLHFNFIIILLLIIIILNNLLDKFPFLNYSLIHYKNGLLITFNSIAISLFSLYFKMTLCCAENILIFLSLSRKTSKNLFKYSLVLYLL